jgi:quinol monooxygenase YgiN
MITRIMKLRLKSSANEFVEYIDSIRDDISKYYGCHNIEVLNDKEDNKIFFIYSIWKNDKVLNKFRNSDFNREFWNTLLGMSEKRPEVWTVENIFEK